MPIDSNFYRTERTESHGDVFNLGNFFAPTQVAGFLVTNPGLTAYTSVPTVGISGGGGASAAGTAIINSAGQLVGILLTNPGTGYTSVPTVTITSGGGTGATATAFLGSSANLTATTLVGLFPASIYRELLVTINAVLVSGTTPSFTFKLQVTDDNGNTWFDLPSGGMTAITAAGRTIFPYTQSQPFGTVVGLFVTVTGTAPVFNGTINVSAK